jgi:hypothetical protein
MASDRQSPIIAALGSIEGKLKLFEESRLKSFENWKFDESEKCSASEVKNVNFN